MYDLIYIYIYIYTHTYIYRRATGRRPPHPFFENWKKVPWFLKKSPYLYLYLDWIFHSKCTFQSIYGKKLQNFCLRGIFFVCFWQKVYQSALTPQNLSCPKRFLVARLIYIYIYIYIYILQIYIYIYIYIYIT